MKMSKEFEEKLMQKKVELKVALGHEDHILNLVDDVARWSHSEAIQEMSRTSNGPFEEFWILMAEQDDILLTKPSRIKHADKYKHVVDIRALQSSNAKLMLAEKREAEMITKIEKIANNIGLDAAVVTYETVWSDPKNVTAQLEQTIKCCELWVKQLRELTQLESEKGVKS